MRETVPHGASLTDLLDDPELLRRRARLCRNQAELTEHETLAAAFLELADALDFAAMAADLASDRVLH
jgi:hypothetical protein